MVLARVQLVQGGATPITGGGADKGQQETGNKRQKQHPAWSALAVLWPSEFYGDKTEKFICMYLSQQLKEVLNLNLEHIFAS